MTDKTFKIPLVGPKKNIAAPNCTFDHKAIGKIYREQLGGNPFGILPDKPDVVGCEYTGCSATFNGVL